MPAAENLAPTSTVTGTLAAEGTSKNVTVKGKPVMKKVTYTVTK